jgi:hypothetical protein
VRSSPNKHDSDLIEKRVAWGGGRCAAQREQARSLQVWWCYQVDGSSWLVFGRSSRHRFNSEFVN